MNQPTVFYIYVWFFTINICRQTVVEFVTKEDIIDEHVFING